MDLPYRIVDVFTDRPFAGNGLCVVTVEDPTAVADELMLAITREVNLSETAFVTPAGDSDYDVRIWTPAGELPFAGHPSLGSAWTLGPGTWTQRSSGAVVSIDANEFGAVMSQPDPVFTEVYPEDAVRAFGLPVSVARAAYVADVGGTRHLLVPTSAPVDRIRPDHDALARVAGSVRATGIGVFAHVDADRVDARVFVPGSSVPEDPGTGSAAAPVGLLATRLWGTQVDVVVHQGVDMGRPCRIEVHAETGNIRVGGSIVGCAEGRFTL